MLKAARDADWMQVVFNQGPPCFFLEGQRFCLRPHRWHDEIAEKVCHKYVPLEQLLKATTQTALEAAVEIAGNPIRFVAGEALLTQRNVCQAILTQIEELKKK